VRETAQTIAMIEKEKQQ